MNLTTNVHTGGDAAGDSLVAIERVVGSNYADTLSSATSGHFLEGGLANDVYIIGNAGVQVVEASSGGDDEVQTALSSHTLAAEVERLTFTGTGNFIGIGNASNNIITAGAGNDILRGGAGADQFFGGSGTDTVSYSDSNGAITLNFDSGVFSGIAAGDTFTSIEKIAGSSFGDVFVGSAAIETIDGGAGVDMMSYISSTSGLTLDLSTNTFSGIASGDILTSIEVYHATNYADFITGDASNNTIIGGAGSDTINGGGGIDGAWYLTSSAAVQINLLSGNLTGGDAAGDTLTSIENIVGSIFDDTITGDNLSNTLEGSDGSDTISGGDGNDFIYGGTNSDIGSIVALGTAAQADILYGGNGIDNIFTATNDSGAIAYGGADVDNITVNKGTAYGGDGDDNIFGNGIGYTLFGEAGSDEFFMFGSGAAYGGEGTDVYHINGPGFAIVRENGTTGVDYIRLNNIATFSQVYTERVGNDLYVTSVTDAADGVVDSGVYLENWYSGGNTIEEFITSNDTHFIIGA